MEQLKVYLDDERVTPDGWTRVYWPDQAIALLKSGMVEEMSLDHDLGDDNRGTGYDVLTWLEEQVIVHGFVPPKKIHVHSSNASAAGKMKAAIAMIYMHHSFKNEDKPELTDVNYLRLARQGNTIDIDGVRFVVEVLKKCNEDTQYIYLTTKATIDLVEDDSSYLYQHIRSKQTDSAVFDREALIELINSGDYYIG